MGAPTKPNTTRNRRVPLDPHPSARFLSLAAAAIWLGIGETTLWHLTKDGELSTVLLGRRRLVPRAELERYEVCLIARGDKKASDSSSAARVAR